MVPWSFEGKFIYWYPSWCMLPIYFFLKQETIDRCKSIVYISCHCYRSTKDSFVTNIKTKFRQTDKLLKFVSDVLWKRSLVSSLNLGPNYGRRGLAQDCPGLIREDWECLVFFFQWPNFSDNCSGLFTAGQNSVALCVAQCPVQIYMSYYVDVYY